MAISPYLRTAAAHLQRAAEESKRESDSIRSGIHEQEIKAHQERRSLETQMRNKQNEVIHAESPGEKVIKQKEVQRLSQEINNLDHELNSFKQQKENEIHQKEMEIQEMNQRAHELFSRAS